MPRLIDAFVRLDAATRVYVRSAGHSRSSRALAAAIAECRPAIAGAALAEAAAAAPPAQTNRGSTPAEQVRMDFEHLVELAAAAGLCWQDMAAIVNRAGERNPGRAL